MEPCIFCKIIKNEIPCAKVYENSSVIAFLDISPVNKGHILVIPKPHFGTILDVPDPNLAEVFKAVKKIAPAAMHAVDAKGFNIGINTYKAAGQLVPHFHVHIIPRFEDDRLESWPGKKYKEKEMQKLAEKIKKLI